MVSKAREISLYQKYLVPCLERVTHVANSFKAAKESAKTANQLWDEFNAKMLELGVDQNYIDQEYRQVLKEDSEELFTEGATNIIAFFNEMSALKERSAKDMLIDLSKLAPSEIKAR